jgi:hypothetical protein
MASFRPSRFLPFFRACIRGATTTSPPIPLPFGRRLLPGDG